jgi:hypothetical protein
MTSMLAPNPNLEREPAPVEDSASIVAWVEHDRSSTSELTEKRRSVNLGHPPRDEAASSHPAGDHQSAKLDHVRNEPPTPDAARTEIPALVPRPLKEEGDAPNS